MRHQHYAVIAVLFQPHDAARPADHRVAGCEFEVEEEVVDPFGAPQLEGGVLDGVIALCVQTVLAEHPPVEGVLVDGEIFADMGAAVARARVGVVVVAGGRHVGNHSVQLREGAGRSLPLLVRRLVARVAVADAVVLLDQIAHAEHQFGVERFGVCGDPAGHDLHDRLVACLFGVALQVGKQDDGPRIGIGEGGFAEFLLCLCRHEECSEQCCEQQPGEENSSEHGFIGL